MGDQHGLGMLFIGVAIGVIIPNLPAPLQIIQPFVWLIFFVIGVVLLIKG
jgi:hypothetical protein